MGAIMKDITTGFVGVVVCRSEYLTGCNRYSLQSRTIDKKTPKPGDWIAFDEDQLIDTGKNVIDEIKVPRTSAPAGPPTRDAVKYGM
jgi:hypothetical protein